MKNKYCGVDPIIIRNIRYQAKRLKLSKCFSHETREDLEQELFCEVWTYLNQYDQEKGKFSTFVAKLAEHRANNLLKKQLCVKRGNQADDISNVEQVMATESFETKVATRIDVDYMISTLPEKLQAICQQLKFFNLSEVAQMNNISRSTLTRTIEKIGKKLAPIYNKNKKKSRT